jgi:hypothetical protein
MSTFARWIAGIALGLLTAGSACRAQDVLANDYGAKGDGAALDTASIQKAIDAAAAVGGTVTMKPGTYLTGSIFLKSGVTLDVPEGATLIGSEKLEDYPMLPTRIAGIEMTWPAALINIRDQHNVTITGKGIIDGDGAVWWKSYNDLRAMYSPRACAGPPTTTRAAAPHTDSELVGRSLGGGITAQALRLLDRADALLARCSSTASPSATTRAGGPSTDGIDIDSSREI